MTVHAEMGPRITFCALFPSQVDAEDQTVACSDWYANPEVIQHVTCESCLLRVFMLGDSAKLKLALMGRVVQVHDAPDEVVRS